jgi:hypothetical protein
MKGFPSSEVILCKELNIGGARIQIRYMYGAEATEYFEILDIIVENR